MKKTLLFFGDKDCLQCKRLLSKIEKYRIKEITRFNYIEAFSEKNQDICDKHNVDEIPHVKLFAPDGELLNDQFGTVNIIELLNKIS